MIKIIQIIILVFIATGVGLWTQNRPEISEQTNSSGSGLQREIKLKQEFKTETRINPESNRIRKTGIEAPIPVSSVSQKDPVSLVKIAELEREITILFNDSNRIGPEHYARLKSDLDTEASAGADLKTISRLRNMLEAVNPATVSSTQTSVAEPTYTVQKQNCASNPSPFFTNHITDMSKVYYIAPPPTMGSGPSLKTHSYIGTNGVYVPIYAPVAMTVKNGSHYVGGPYMFEFAASCEVTVRFGHMTNPVDSIKKLLPAEPKSDSRTQELSSVSFAAGELIGYTTGTSAAGNWDFGVYNSSVSNRYANDPEWNNSAVYTTAVCPFDYFTPGLKEAYAYKFNSTILGGNPPHGESFCK